MTRIPITFSYTRLSSDQDGKRADHATQNRHIAEICSTRRLPTPEHDHRFTDDDRSASSLTTERPGWMALRLAIAELDSDRFFPILVASARDRLTRRIEELPALADLIEGAGGRLITHRDGEISVTTGGRDGMIFGGAVDHLESERIKKRTRDGQATTAMAGKRHGAVPWGWRIEITSVDRQGNTQSTMVRDPDQHRTLLRMAVWLIGGLSLREIVRRLNNAGIPAPGAGRVMARDPETREPIKVARSDWTTHAVRHVLTRRANVGVRQHTPTHGRDRSTREYAGEWPPLMPEHLYARVCAVLTAPERRTSRSNASRHLLSTIATCATCGSPVHVWGSKTRAKDAPKYAAYNCPSHHVVKTQAKVDAYVEQWIMAYLQNPQVRAEYLRGREDGSAEVLSDLEGARAQADELAHLWAGRKANRITAAQFATMNAAVQEQITDLEARLAQLRSRDVYGSIMTCEDVSAAWEMMDISQQRAIIAALCTIRLAPSSRRGRGAFDASTILIAPRT